MKQFKDNFTQQQYDNIEEIILQTHILVTM